MSDPTQQNIATAILAFIAGSLPVLVNWALKRMRVANDAAAAKLAVQTAVDHEDDERADQSYKYVIKKLEDSNARLDQRVSALESALRQSQTDHQDCERKHERLQGKVEVLEADKKAQGVRIVELELQVRKLQEGTV